MEDYALLPAKVVEFNVFLKNVELEKMSCNFKQVASTLRYTILCQY